LWVEDFGAEAEDLIDQVFSGILSPDLRQQLAETQGRQGKSKRPNGYEAWRKWYGNSSVSDEIEIDVYCRSVDFDETARSGYLIDRYDAVLLDVNLEQDFFDTTSMPPNPRKGGFWLYNKLVRAGFPSGRIALLTAHDRETATSEFQAACEEYGHEVLCAFGKSDQAVGEWIKCLSSEHNAFLQLRRGVLDSIELAENLLPGDQLDVRFNDFLATEDWSAVHALDYICTMRHLMPIRVIASERQNQFRGFRYLLGCEWDRAEPGNATETAYQSLGRVMKYLRNWSSHGHLLDGANIGHLAFLALASMRTTFRFSSEFESKQRRVERHLLAAIGNSQPVELPVLATKLAWSYIRARRLLREKINNQDLSLSRKIKTDGKKWQPAPLEDQQHFGAIVNELATAQNPPSDLDFPSALCEIFVHAALKVRPRLLFEWTDSIEGNTVIESAYLDAFQKCHQELPAWVLDIWCRFRIV
jgi:hypothetical protein